MKKKYLENINLFNEDSLILNEEEKDQQLTNDAQEIEAEKTLEDSNFFEKFKKQIIAYNENLVSLYMDEQGNIESRNKTNLSKQQQRLISKVIKKAKFAYKSYYEEV